MSDPFRASVLSALLKHYDIKELAQSEKCPLCGHEIGEYTWTVLCYATFDTIGLTGVQCSNENCLLRRGIIYEQDGKRLQAWQAKRKQEATE